MCSLNLVISLLVKTWGGIVEYEHISTLYIFPKGLTVVHHFDVTEGTLLKYLFHTINNYILICILD